MFLQLILLLQLLVVLILLLGVQARGILPVGLQ